MNETKFAQAALSNMLGGIGYFYGSSRVQSAYTKEPVPYWKAPLYTAVPSRYFFSLKNLNLLDDFFSVAGVSFLEVFFGMKASMGS